MIELWNQYVDSLDSSLSSLYKRRYRWRLFCRLTTDYVSTATVVYARTGTSTPVSRKMLNTLQYQVVQDNSSTNLQICKYQVVACNQVDGSVVESKDDHSSIPRRSWH
jgi:hypothetical protein